VFATRSRCKQINKTRDEKCISPNVFMNKCEPTFAVVTSVRITV